MDKADVLEEAAQDLDYFALLALQEGELGAARDHSKLGADLRGLAGVYRGGEESQS